ncbi:unnamed protein product [Lampetra planeri]
MRLADSTREESPRDKERERGKTRYCVGSFTVAPGGGGESRTEQAPSSAAMEAHGQRAPTGISPPTPPRACRTTLSASDDVLRTAALSLI